MALAVPVSDRATAQEAKWQPWIEVGGAVGSDHSFGDVDMFIPVWQDQTSLLFGDLRGTFTTSPTQEGNFGLGYRTQIDPGWILGGYGFIDIQNSENDNLFYQGSVGAELLSVDWDLRLNGYFPFNSGGKSTGSNNGHLEISGTNIGITHDMEKPLFGFDGEVGWRLPIFPAEGDLDVRAFVGGYYFANSDVETVAGPRGRLEVRLYDLDFLGVQSRLTFDGEVQWDSPRGTQGFGGLELRIPLGVVTGAPGPKLSPLDRRMVDRVQRDVDIVTQEYQSDPNDVIVDGLTVKTHTIVFAEEGGTGNGTKGNPTSLENAPALAAAKGQNAIIVVRGDAGPIDLSGQPLQLENGQALLGGGSTVRLTDAEDSDIRTGFHAPGARPTVIGSTSSANLIQMYSGGQNRVTGLDLEGSFANAIFGSNMQRAIVTDNFIDPPASNGILLHNSGAAIPTSQFAYIARNSVDGAGSAGIAVKSYLSDALAHTQTIVIADNIVAGVADGLQLGTFASGLAGLSQTVLIAGNSLSGIGRDAIQLREILQGVDAAQSLSIYGNVIADAGRDGIQLLLADGRADDAALSAAIGGNAIASAGRSGIYVSAALSDLAGATAGLAIDGNTVGTAGINGINVVLAATSLGSLDQRFAIDGNGVGSAGLFGVDTRLLVQDVGGPVDLDLAFDGNTIGDGAAAGLFVNPAFFNIGSLTQAVTFASNTVGRAGTGIELNEIADNVTGAVASTLLFEGNTVTSGTGAGIVLNFNVAGLGSLAQSAAVIGNSIGSVAGSGISVLETVGAVGPTSLAETVAGNSVAAAGNSGIYLRILPGTIGSFAQSTAVTDNEVGTAGRDGIRVLQSLDGVTVASSSLALSGNSVTSAAAAGIYLSQAVASASLGQSLSIAGNTVSAAGTNGIASLLYGGSGAAVTQTGTISGNGVQHATLNGLDIAAGGSGTVGISLGLSGNTLSQNGQNGFAGFASGPGTTATLTLVSGSGNHFTGNAGFGAYLSAGGGSSITFHINGNDLGGNTGGTTSANGAVTVTP
ncbi:MAG: inverse autotransporter beta domain-containing protein [Dongiaceae bacterium]